MLLMLTTTIVMTMPVNKSTLKGVNRRSKYVTQVQRQKPESPTVTLTWHECKYKVHQLHQRYIFRTKPVIATLQTHTHRATLNQTNIGTVSKATLQKLLRDWVERIWAFPSA